MPSKVPSNLGFLSRLKLLTFLGNSITGYLISNSLVSKSINSASPSSKLFLSKSRILSNSFGFSSARLVSSY
jgi:hypothetical protein